MVDLVTNKGQRYDSEVQKEIGVDISNWPEFARKEHSKAHSRNFTNILSEFRIQLKTVVCSDSL